MNKLHIKREVRKKIKRALPELYAIASLDDYFAFLSAMTVPEVSSTTIELFEVLIPAMKGEFDIALSLLQKNRSVAEHVGSAFAGVLSGALGWRSS